MSEHSTALISDICNVKILQRLAAFCKNLLNHSQLTIIDYSKETHNTWVHALIVMNPELLTVKKFR